MSRTYLVFLLLATQLSYCAAPTTEQKPDKEAFLQRIGNVALSTCIGCAEGIVLSTCVQHSLACPWEEIGAARAWLLAGLGSAVGAAWATYRAADARYIGMQMLCSLAVMAIRMERHG